MGADADPFKRARVLQALGLSFSCKMKGVASGSSPREGMFFEDQLAQALIKDVGVDFSRGDIGVSQ